jgi:hypothetical protein
MHTMSRPRPPHLHREVTRHGKSVWYVRVGKGPRIRLLAGYGSPEFSAEYQAALEGRALPTQAKEGAAGSLAWLIARYRESSAWSPGLSATTRALRDLTFKQCSRRPAAFPLLGSHRQ